MKIMAYSPITLWQQDGETMETMIDFIFLVSKITIDGYWSHKIKRCLPLWRKTMIDLDSLLKSTDITWLTKFHLVKAMIFSSSHVWIWELDHKESWALKNWCFWIAVLEKTLERPLGFKEIQPVHSKVDQSWMFIGRADADAEAPIPSPPDVKKWLFGKDSDDWRWEEKETTEDEMVWRHHWLNEHEFE